MQSGPRQLAVGTICGALAGVGAFVGVAMLRVSAGGDLVVSLAWGALALTALVLLGRIVDGILWTPALLTPVRADEPGESDESESADTDPMAEDSRGLNVDLSVNDDTEAVRPPEPTPAPVTDVAEAA